MYYRHAMNAFSHNMRMIGLSALLVAGSGLSAAVCQTNQNALTSSQTASRPAADRNKYAVIISGASGEAAYARQFSQWTLALRASLVGKFGFAEDRLKILIEKPIDSTAAPAIAEEVKRLFGTLRTELEPDNVLFIFLIGHGAF